MSLAIEPAEVLRLGAAARAGGAVRVGEKPPHEDDVWISTDDALDYAAWLDRRVEELDASFLAWLDSPETFARALEWNRKTGFGKDPWHVTDPWVEQWRRYFAELQGSW